MLGLNWLFRKLTGRVAGTDAFAKKCEAAFREVDHDGSGTLDKTELHLAVMMVYDRLNAAHRAAASLETRITPSVRVVEDLLQGLVGRDATWSLKL